ncbi:MULTISPECIES: hypothetical protein [Nonomuraea]|uniref:Uncharacterized protein n=1 Tax=Nonomuraea salmonea TaxID=46181 RepID=A0ABV5P3W5_9ACTN
MPVAKAGTSSDVLSRLLDAHAAEPGAAEAEVVLCGIGEQPRHLRDDPADVALMHRPYASPHASRRPDRPPTGVRESEGAADYTH